MGTEDAKHAEAVAKLLSSGYPSTQRTAIEALGWMGTEGAKHAEAVAKLLSSGDPSTQRAAIEVLGEMGAEGAKHAEAVLTLLNSDDRETRDEAQSALRSWAMTEVLTGPRLLPLCLEGVLSNRDEAAEFRLTCHLLGLSVPPPPVEGY